MRTARSYDAISRQGVPMNRSAYIAAELASAETVYRRLMRSVAAVGTLILVMIFAGA
jgi:hypothetical protein